MKMRRLPVAAPLLRSMVGAFSLHPDLVTADRAARRYLPRSHTDPANVALHEAFASEVRCSDYPVLFHLARALPANGVLFDLGGSVGNLAWCYRRYLDLPPEFEWIVCDLPETVEIGRRLARDWADDGLLHFTTRLSTAAEAGILLASGSLHYFEQSLPELLSGFAHRPDHVLVNRTPLTRGPTSVTVQDAGFVMMGCKVFNCDELVGGMKRLDYQLVDGWVVPELNIRIPLYPERSAPHYSGFYFRRTRVGTRAVA